MSAPTLDGLPDGVVVIARGVIQELNRTAERLTGWSREEAIGKPWGDVLRLRATAGFIVHEQADPFSKAPRVASGSPAREYMLTSRSGGQRWVSVRTRFRWENAELAEVTATIRDTGRRHRVELSAYDLIATLAHDLRSPLTSVKGFTATLIRNWAKFSDEQKLHMLNTIVWDADRMGRLLTDLLDLSRLEAGRLELRLQDVDLAALAEQVGHRVGMDHEKTHTVEVDFPPGMPTVEADPGKVEQVLVNLIENAAKHGDPGRILVTGALNGTHVVVRVQDSGPGIDARHAPYVFSKFYRRSTGERHVGTGLGLYICKGIIEAHGGHISIERTDPSGTVFAFTLPLEKA